MVWETAKTLPEGSTERLRMIRLLDDAFQPVNLQLVGTEEFQQQVEHAIRSIKDGLDAIGPGLGRMTLVGHAHIDTAWLWPLSETRRKCGRTFSNVLRLMEQYPDFRFSQSQPQLYQFAKENFPELYAGMKERVASGQWEVARRRLGRMRLQHLRRRGVDPATALRQTLLPPRVRHRHESRLVAGCLRL